jgi:hypothetical protein
MENLNIWVKFLSKIASFELIFMSVEKKFYVA